MTPGKIKKSCPAADAAGQFVHRSVSRSLNAGFSSWALDSVRTTEEVSAWELPLELDWESGHLASCLESEDLRPCWESED